MGKKHGRLEGQGLANEMAKGMDSGMGKDTPIEISLIIPSYREEENLRLLLPRVTQSLAGTGLSFEVLILDTQTPLDKTEAVAKENRVRYTPRENGNFYGDAVRTGIKHSRGKYVMFMDADGSHAPEFLPSLISARESAEVIVGSRYVEGGDTENSPALIIMSKIVNITYALVLGLKCKDVSNSFKLYRRDQLAALTLYCANFDIIEEILFKLSRQYKVRIKELPFTFKKRMFGDSKRNLLSFMLTYVVTLLKLRFGK